VDKTKLVALMNTHVTQANLNEFGRFDDLKASVDQQKAKAYFEGLEGNQLPLFRVNIRTAKLLQDFIIQGGLLSNFHGAGPRHPGA
jgi:type I restriction enzyme R subunit